MTCTSRHRACTGPSLKTYNHTKREEPVGGQALYRSNIDYWLIDRFITTKLIYCTIDITTPLHKLSTKSCDFGWKKKTRSGQECQSTILFSMLHFKINLYATLENRKSKRVWLSAFPPALCTTFLPSVSMSHQETNNTGPQTLQCILEKHQAVLQEK